MCWNKIRAHKARTTIIILLKSDLIIAQDQDLPTVQDVNLVIDGGVEL